jgi:thioredoxin-like negative regulator of GroEL
MTKKAIRFTAPWCGPCKAYAPMFETVSKEITDWEFETVDIDQNPEISTEYSIRSIPTTVFLIGDHVIAKISGVLQPKQLKEKLEELATTK